MRTIGAYGDTLTNHGISTIAKRSLLKGETSSMAVALIWAMAKNRVIGRDGGLPWRLRDDMRHFMNTTMGQPVIMGRRTFESMPGPLPGRANIVLTSRADYPAQGILVASDFDAGLACAEKQCAEGGKHTAFVIGGARVYELALPVADQLFVTWVQAEVDGDTWFPEVDWRLWRETSSRNHAADAAHDHPFRIASYVRRQT